MTVTACLTIEIFIATSVSALTRPYDVMVSHSKVAKPHGPQNESMKNDEDESNDEYEFNVNHLGFKLLSIPCEVCRQILLHNVMVNCHCQGLIYPS